MEVREGEEIVAFGGVTPRLLRVERVTKTTFIAGGNKYSKTTGRMHGCSAWHMRWAEPATEKNLALLKEAEDDAAMCSRISAARAFLRDLKLAADNIEQVEAFIAEMKTPNVQGQGRCATLYRAASPAPQGWASVANTY